MDRFDFFGKEIRLHRNYGAFITMNPGYASPARSLDLMVLGVSPSIADSATAPHLTKHAEIAFIAALAYPTHMPPPPFSGTPGARSCPTP